MRVALVGSRWFGAQVLRLLLERHHEVFVVALKADDHLTQAAQAAGSPLLVLDGARRVLPQHLPDEIDVIVAAHAHAFIVAEACAKAKRAAIGYHPSLLPRHRGIAAVEWTIRCRDPIAGGSIYHLTNGLDGGPIAAQDWCFVYPEDDANSLWRRALGPMGLRLLMQVVDFIDAHGYAEAREQDPKALTQAPALKKAAE
jgi:methionyl-tRNA formyltransferase